jgi:hypothetical protein
METDEPLLPEVELAGLDGSNLLGYLAALGTLRVLTVADAEARVRMRWVDNGLWTPVLFHSKIATVEELLTSLEQKVCGESSANAAWKIGDDLTLTRAAFREHLEAHSERAGSSERETVDYLTAFGTEAFGVGPKKEQMSDTEFRTMSGAGHQHFLGFMRELAAETVREQLRRALLEPWDYGDDRPSLRWDPTDYRPHALRAEAPSGDPIKTMRGANRLAIEALPLFPAIPARRRLHTVGFEDRNKETEITWPIWTDRLGLDTVRTLLASEEVQKGDRSTMARRGVAQIFRAKRFTEGQYRNFSPARALL